MASSLFLYGLYCLIALSSLGIWMAKSCVLAVFSLAAVFALGALLFFFLGAEFLAILLLIIYSGAIILLFLFVIFLLNLRVVELYNLFTFYLPIGGTLSVLSLCVLVVLFAPQKSSHWAPFSGPRWGALLFQQANLTLLGQLLYEHQGLMVVAVALLLLTVLVTVIVLSLQLKSHSPAPSKELFSVRPEGALSLWGPRAKVQRGAATSPLLRQNHD